MLICLSLIFAAAGAAPVWKAPGLQTISQTDGLKDDVTQWAQENLIDMSPLFQDDLATFFTRIGYQPAGPPCVLLVYSMVHHRRPSMTRCLPAGSDLTRDFLKEQIAQDVDMTEELDAASVVLIVIHILVTAIGLACYCTRSVCATPAATPQKTLLATPQTEYLNSANANASASPDANGKGEDDIADGLALTSAAAVTGNDAPLADPTIPMENDSASIPAIDALITAL